ncbi:hypothetical protein HPB50_017763 [Hyalomma asiaticum]|uniref:Uncharacterized protein n=1 Tax=Hyalomma asiaticum TaxID=266040 RepID=A0ACB7TK96_HYAAI|nr:hypothetical protein HPB50_017763 [Hyalomma asiaticum]
MPIKWKLVIGCVRKKTVGQCSKSVSVSLPGKPQPHQLYSCQRPGRRSAMEAQQLACEKSAFGKFACWRRLTHAPRRTLMGRIAWR